MNRLVVRSEDTYWMPEPPTAIGGVRTALTSYDLRVDQTAYTTLALLAGIRADSSAKAPVLGGDDDASRRSLGLPSADAEPSVPAAELLTERTAVRLLLDVELLTGREIVDGPIEVRRSARRNHNLSVRTTGGLGFLIKQARIPESVATLRNEASVLNALASCDGMTGNIPRLAHYNAPLAALILELLPGQPLRASLRQLREWHMLRLGGALAQAHTVQPGGLRQDHRVPLGIALHRPTLELLRDASRANVQLLEAVHTDSYLCEHLASLEASWQQSHFIHGDIKLDNVVANDLGDTKELVIVDWEAASWGERRWDVGCAIGEVMHAWVVEAVGRELGLPSLEPGGEGPSGLDYSRCLIDALVEGYTASGDPPTAAFIMDCFGFAAARLVQAAYEGLQLRHEMDLYAVKTVQLAANIAKDPELVAERFADLRTTQ